MSVAHLAAAGDSATSDCAPNPLRENRDETLQHIYLYLLDNVLGSHDEISMHTTRRAWPFDIVRHGFGIVGRTFRDGETWFRNCGQ